MSVYSPYTKKYQNPNPISEKTISISNAKEEEKKIASMGLGELKDFACPKALQHKKDWYMTCVSCDGVNNCKPGRRVLEILENDTKPEEKVSQIDKFNAKFGNVEKPVVKGVNEKYALLGKEGYIKTLQQPDPIAYLMKMNGTSLNGARQRLYKWKQKYPDVAEYYYNFGTVENKIAHSIVSPTDGRIANNARTSEEARQRVISAFTYPDGVYAYYENVRGYAVSRNNRTNIRNRIRELAKKYPDLDKEYHISVWMEANRVHSGRKGSDTLPEENMVHLRLNKVSEPSSDEVSVDDFLAEMDEKKAEDYGKKVDPVEVPEEEPVAVEEPFDTIKAEAEIQEKAEKDRNKQNRLAACLVFSEKRIELVKAINERRIMINKLQEEMNDFNDKLKKLDAAAEIMGFVVDGGT